MGVVVVCVDSHGYEPNCTVHSELWRHWYLQVDVLWRLKG